MPISLVVKNTFLCIEEESPLSPLAARRRAKTADVATLRRQASLGPIKAEAGDDEREVLTVGKTSSAPAAMGARGHVAALAAGLEAGGASAAVALDEVRGSVRSLAFDPAGSDLVLRALGVLSASETMALAAGLRGVVCEAARSSSACRVLDEILRRVGSEDTAFIALELLEQNPAAFALNPNGSSTLCRVIEFSASAARTAALVDATLAADVTMLCCHKFGHEVAMSILSNGTPRQRCRIVSALCCDVQRFARHRFASKVFEQALVLCPDEERDALVSGLLARPGTVVALACHNFAVSIVRELLQMPGVSHQVQALLLKSYGRVSRDKFGSELMRELGMGTQLPQNASGLQEHAVYQAGSVAFAIYGA